MYDWSILYPDVANKISNIYDKQVEMLDIGCGYGGLLSKNFIFIIYIVFRGGTKCLDKGKSWGI